LFLIGLFLKKIFFSETALPNESKLGMVIYKECAFSSYPLINMAATVNKHGCHRPFLFLIGRFPKIFFSVTA
jgi:hypothetical protein